MTPPAFAFASCRSRRNVFCGACTASNKRQRRRCPRRRSDPRSASRIWQSPFARRTGVFATAAALCAAVVGIGAAVLPWRAIAPIARPDASVYSQATIARGQQLAALGDCAVCHTSVNGILNAGGRPLPTPFGTIYSTNITPDVETGIGAWSYPAFERAMREGIHRDGRHLYPAFPYTHFARTTDADMQALYAYLMAQPPVRAETPDNVLAFPFNLRPLMAGWNALFHKPDVFQARSDQIRNLESRRLSGRRARPLQRLPFAAQRARRGDGERASRRRICGRLGSPGADLAVAGADPLERGRTVRVFADRRIPLPWRCGRADGAGGEGARRPAQFRHPRHGGLSRLVQRQRPSTSRRRKRLPPDSKPRPARERPQHPASAPGSIRVPARSAMRSAAHRCSAAALRWR